MSDIYICKMCNKDFETKETLFEHFMENYVSMEKHDYSEGRLSRNETNIDRPLFTLVHLFDALQEEAETRADVREVIIRVEDMVRLRGVANHQLLIKTKHELHGYKQWDELLEEYYPIGHVKTTCTTMDELRGFFDEDMLEFFKEYRPVIIYNDTEITLEEFLNSHDVLEFGENRDT